MQPENEETNLETEMYTPDATDEDSDLAAEQETDEKDLEKPANDEEVAHWDAAESIDVQKNVLWFILFAIVVIALVAADILFIKSYTFSALVIVMAVALIIHSIRPPRMINYTLSNDQGLYIGEKLYHFSEFKSFGLILDRGYHSIMLIPVKRFSFGVSVYFPEDAGEKIVDIFGSRLPMQDVKPDVIDVIVRKLRL